MSFQISFIYKRITKTTKKQKDITVVRITKTKT